MSEAIYRQNGGQQDYTPSSAATAGQVLQLNDGRAAVVKTDLAASAKGAVYTAGIFDVLSASSTAFSVGDRVYWDYSADLAITEAEAIGEDFYIGTAVVAKVAYELAVRTDLNASPVVTGRALQSRVYEFDCQTGEDSAVHVLIPPAWNKTGLLILDTIGIVTEVFAGATQDQGIVTIKDTAGTPNTIGTVTAADASADALNDVLVGTGGASRATSGDAGKLVAAGLGVTGAVTQPTSGTSAAGKMKVRVLAAPVT